MQDGVLKLFAKASAELGRVLQPGVCVSPLFSVLACEILGIRLTEIQVKGIMAVEEPDRFLKSLEGAVLSRGICLDVERLRGNRCILFGVRAMFSGYVDPGRSLLLRIQ